MNSLEVINKIFRKNRVYYLASIPWFVRMLRFDRHRIPLSDTKKLEPRKDEGFTPHPRIKPARCFSSGAPVYTD